MADFKLIEEVLHTHKKKKKKKPRTNKDLPNQLKIMGLKKVCKIKFVWSDICSQVMELHEENQWSKINKWSQLLALHLGRWMSAGFTEEPTTVGPTKKVPTCLLYLPYVHDED